MRHPIAWALAAIFALAAVAFLVIAIAEGPETPAAGGIGPRPYASPIPQPTSAALAAAAASATAAPADTSPSDRSTPLPAAVVVTPVAARDATWDDVKVASRASELGPFAGAVHAALGSARDRMDPCFTDESTRLASAPAPSVDPNDPPRGAAVVILDLQGADGELEIVSTSLDYLGTSTREFVQCCERHLVGLRIPAASAKPGQRLRLKYVLQ